MKNKLLIFGSILVALIVAVVVGIVSYNAGYTKGYIEGFSKVGTGESCTLNSDCKTPVDYLIRSSCPFVSKCIENNCNVVCVGLYKSEQDELSEISQCNKNADCDCSTFYGGSDIKKCLCINGLCNAVVSE